MDSAIHKLNTAPVPALFRGALLAAKVADPNAIIGGGALRDWLNDRLVKDIDIFVGPEMPILGWDRVYGTHGTQTVTANSAEYLSLFGVLACFQHPWQGTVINTISLTDELSLLQHMERFDLGLCQVAFDGEDVWATDAFLKDREEGAFTLVRCESVADFLRSQARHERLSEKYEDWPLVVPEEFKKFDPAETELELDSIFTV